MRDSPLLTFSKFTYKIESSSQISSVLIRVQMNSNLNNSDKRLFASAFFFFFFGLRVSISKCGMCMIS